MQKKKDAVSEADDALLEANGKAGTKIFEMLFEPRTSAWKCWFGTVRFLANSEALLNLQQERISSFPVENSSDFHDNIFHDIKYQIAVNNKDSIFQTLQTIIFRNLSHEGKIFKLDDSFVELVEKFESRHRTVSFNVFNNLD